MLLPSACGDGLAARRGLGARSVLPLFTQQVFGGTLGVRLCPKCLWYPTEQQPKISTLPVLILELSSERWLASGLLAQTMEATCVSPAAGSWRGARKCVGGRGRAASRTTLPRTSAPGYFPCLWQE